MPIAGGEDTCVYRFHAASSAVPQVLCVLPPQQSMASLTRMRMIVSALSTAGVKTPQYLRICADEALFGGLAAVMDFIEGLPLEFGNIGHARLLGQFHAELHSRDVSSVINTLDAHHLPREQWLSPDTIHRCLFRWSQNHPWLKPVIDWMDDNFDLDQDLAICHGDFRPNNIFVRNSELVGIVDWNFGIAPAVFDVGFTLTGMEILTRDRSPQCTEAQSREANRVYLNSYCEFSGLTHSQIERHQVFSAVHFLLGALYSNLSSLKHPAVICDLRTLIGSLTGLHLRGPGDDSQS